MKEPPLKVARRKVDAAGREVGLQDREMDLYRIGQLPSVVAALEARKKIWDEGKDWDAPETPCGDSPFQQHCEHWYDGHICHYCLAV